MNKKPHKYSSDDNPIIEYFQKDEERAFAMTYEKYFYQLVNYGRQFLVNEALVEDCIQEVFITLWNRRQHLHEIHSMKAYLFTMLRRNIFEKIKEKKNTEEHKLDFPSFELTLSHESHLIQEQSDLEISHRLGQGIEKLTKRQREALYLVYFDGLSYDEASMVMDVKVKALYNLVYEALKKLKSVLLTSGLTTIIFSLISLVFLFLFI